MRESWAGGVIWGLYVFQWLFAICLAVLVKVQSLFTGLCHGLRGMCVWVIMVALWLLVGARFCAPFGSLVVAHIDIAIITYVCRLDMS